MEFWEQKNAFEKEKERRNQKFEKLSRNRLHDVLATHMKTIMIGALSDFEKAFGELWGHGLSDSQLSEKQDKIREIWNEVRTSILDRGNNKIKHMRSELNRHNVQWNRYVTKFEVRNDNEY